MMVLKRILVPHDFSETSEAAVRYAVALARNFKAQLYVLHIGEKAQSDLQTEFPLGLDGAAWEERARSEALRLEGERSTAASDVAELEGQEKHAARVFEGDARLLANGAITRMSYEQDELSLSQARDRLRGRDKSEIARVFQRGIGEGLRDAAATLCRAHGVDTVVLSGGVFQNELLSNDLKSLLEPEHLQIWTNQVVPSNDGGISLGQAALAALTNPETGASHDETDSAWTAHVT